MSKVIPPRAELEEFLILLQQYRHACARNSRADEPDRPYFGPDRMSSAAIVWRDVNQMLTSRDFLVPLGWPSIVFQVFEGMRTNWPVQHFQGNEFTSALDRLDSWIAALETALSENAPNNEEQVFEAPVEPAAPQTEATTHLDASEIDQRVTTTDPSRQSPGLAQASKAPMGTTGTPKRRRGRKRNKPTADEDRFLKAWKTGKYATYLDCIEAIRLSGIVSQKRAGQIVDADQQRARRRSDRIPGQ